MLVKITPANLLKDDSRGQSFSFTARSSDNFVILYRKKYSIDGKHYHLGKTKSKNPEVLFLAKGSMKLIVRDVKSRVVEEHIVKENSLIEIPAFVYHEIHVLEDIILIELSCEKSDFNNDTQREDG